MSDSKIAKKWFDVFTSGKYSSKDQARAKAEAVRVFQVMNDRSFNLVFADDSVLGIQQEPTDDPVIVKHFFKWGMWNEKSGPTYEA